MLIGYECVLAGQLPSWGQPVCFLMHQWEGKGSAQGNEHLSWDELAMSAFPCCSVCMGSVWSHFPLSSLIFNEPTQKSFPSKGLPSLPGLCIPRPWARPPCFASEYCVPFMIALSRVLSSHIWFNLSFLLDLELHDNRTRSIVASHYCSSHSGII